MTFRAKKNITIGILGALLISGAIAFSSLQTMYARKELGIDYTKIIASTDIDAETVKVAYSTDTVVPYLEEEVVEKRTPSSQTVLVSENPDGSKTYKLIAYAVANFYPDPADGQWKQVEYATTTQDIFNKAMGFGGLVRKAFADTASIYAGSGDGLIYNDEGFNGWDVTHDALAGDSALSTFLGAGVVRGDQVLTLRRIIYRGFIPIDTSSIDNDATISSASLFMWPTLKSSEFATAYTYLNIVQATAPANATTDLVAADYDLCGDVNNPAEGSTDKQVADFVTGAYYEWVLNATGIGWISKTGVTKFGIRSGHDIDDVDPGTEASANADSYVLFAYSETDGTSQDPYLAVTYTVPGQEADTSTPPSIRINDGQIRINGTRIIIP